MSTAKHWETAPEDIIPFVQKFGFGIGQLANNFYTGALGVFMVILVMGLKMDPLLAGILAAAPRIMDAVTDPLMGYVTDNIRTRFGRRKPFLAIGATITGLSYMAMWQLYPENGMMYNFWYFLGFSFIFYFGYTIFATPLLALGFEMTPDYHERTRLQAFASWFGNVAWIVVPWLWVIVYDTSLFDDPAAGCRELSIWIGAFCIIIGWVPAILCKERVVEDEGADFSFSEIPAIFKDFFTGIIEALKCVPFLKQCISTTLIFNGFQLVAVFAFYVTIYYVFNGDTQAAGNWPPLTGSISAVIGCLFAIPMITLMSNKFGKKKAFIYSTVISFIGYGLKWWCFIPGSPEYMFIPMPFQAFGIGGLFMLMGSMIADVCDLDELNTGKRREGTFGAVYWFTVKVGLAIALALSGIVLKFVGFDQNVAVQSADTLTQLRIADIVIPIAAAVIAIFVMWNYDLSEERAHEIRAELEKRRGKVNHQGEELETPT